MTQNQLAYARINEDKRHNQYTEAEQTASRIEATRHNYASEFLSQQQVDESVRHNKAYERETQRHNVAGEMLNVIGLRETKRHNVRTEGIALGQLEQQTITNNFNRWLDERKLNISSEQLKLSHGATLSDIALKKAQTKTEGYKQSEALSKTIGNYVGNVVDIAGEARQWTGGISGIQSMGAAKQLGLF